MFLFPSNDNVSFVPLLVFIKIALPDTPLFDISIMFADALSFFVSHESAERSAINNNLFKSGIRL